MNKILISCRQKKNRLSQRKIRFLISRILLELKIENRVLSVLLADDKEIKKLNERFLKRNKPTDVLAFSMREGKFAKINQSKLLGDVVVSVETAKRNAVERRLSLIKEVSLYLIHGILHLLGYCDYGKKKIKMKKKESEIFHAIWNGEN